MLGARQQLGLMFRNFCLGYYETTKDSGVFLTSLKIWLYFFRECFFLPSVEDSFRSHLVWAKRRDINLKTIVTARCLTSTVVLSLMVSTDVAVIYSPSKPADKIRKALGDEHIDSLSYWVGISVCVSVSSWTQLEPHEYFQMARKPHEVYGNFSYLFPLAL